MSQYFIPPRQSTSRTRQDDSPTFTPQHHEDIQSAVYIFPSPAADQGSSSPALSSAISFPTDITLSSYHLASGHSRDGSRDSRLSWEEFGPRQRSVSIGTGSPSDLEVEVWEWPAEEEEGVVSEGTGVDVGLEAAVERANRWDLLRRRPLVDRFSTDYIEERLQFRRRLRAISMSPSWDGDPRTRKLSSPGTPSRVRARSPAPHPPLRIPLLSFFSSLLSLDDSTMHLLTHTPHPHSSELFPGPQLFISNLDDISAEEKLHSRNTSDLGESDLRHLKRGIAIATDSSVQPSNTFALPMIDIWSIVTGVWKNTGKVWTEVWRPVTQPSAVAT
ncbi:hypothetical protein BD410DRAFT_787678 [Rickenella mellea]|uniref:Uncharacterized protein n=1 Tax=Rickenella mellea TaxID=50990 RepID=A0A4Y7Q933_9AGAM|nr:hypothetical protein BD410DRAFT_787678 [Rickenella mellea]